MTSTSTSTGRRAGPRKSKAARDGDTMRPAMPQKITRTGRCLQIAVISIALLTTASAQQTSKNPDVITVFTTRSIATVLDRIGAEFEQTTGYRLDVTTDIAITMVRRIQAGEPFDFLVAAPEHIDALIKDGMIAADTRTDLARSGIGVAVRAGAAKPDIRSVESFRRALLNAKSIAYLREGQSGVYLAGMLQRLGIAGAIESKLTRPTADIVSELVAKGDVEIGMVVVTQILTTPGVELVGELPDELQSYIVFTGGVSTRARAPLAARALMTFLASPTSINVMRSQGMR